MKIERRDVAGVSELVGLEGINDIGHSVGTRFGRLEGSVRDLACVVDFSGSRWSLRRSASNRDWSGNN